MTSAASVARTLLNKVPSVTFVFWITSVLATAVGATVADLVQVNLGPALMIAPVVLLVATLVAQFRLRRYLPAVYWLAVVLISVVATLITDTLGVPLWATTAAFAVALAASLGVWFAVERTVSIHTIVTTRREAFYWLVMLFTIALGTAAGDLLAKGLDLGYLLAVLLFAGAIAAVAVVYFFFRLNAVLAFWIAYVLTRPLGASLGDLLSQPQQDGGVGLGTTGTSVLFLLTILALVVVLTIRERRVATGPVLPA